MNDNDRTQGQIRVYRADRIDRRPETRGFSAEAIARALTFAGAPVRVEWVAMLTRSHHLDLIRYAEQIVKRGHATRVPSILVEGLRNAAENGMPAPAPADVVGSGS